MSNPRPKNPKKKGWRKCAQCRKMRPGPDAAEPSEYPDPMPKQHPVCDKCRRGDFAGEPPIPLDPDSDLAQSLDRLIEYARQVSPDAPLHLGSAFAGMRVAAAAISAKHDSAGAAWTAYISLNRQVLDTLRSVYGSASLDLVEQMWKRVEETAAKRAALGWETEPPPGVLADDEAAE